MTHDDIENYQFLNCMVNFSAICFLLEMTDLVHGQCFAVYISVVFLKANKKNDKCFWNEIKFKNVLPGLLVFPSFVPVFSLIIFPSCHS